MKKLVISAGDPAGIGPDICIKAFGRKKNLNYSPVIFGDPEIFEERAKLLGCSIDIQEYKGEDSGKISKDSLWIEPFFIRKRVKPGEPDPSYAKYLMDILEHAISRTMKGEFSGLVTGPINKELINKAGIKFQGHTEVLSKLSNSPKVLMMLASGNLKVALATIHLPLKEVPEAITYEHIEDCINILNENLKTKWKIISPRIKILGLNPHAGDGGFIGKEEINVISPVVEDLKKEGIDLIGPVSADTAFLSQGSSKVDAFLAMYHDQGLPVIKTLGFGKTINITLGLPFIRTSVDHGTAYEIAGKNVVDPGSMEKAARFAAKISSI